MQDICNNNLDKLPENPLEADSISAVTNGTSGGHSDAVEETASEKCPERTRDELCGDLCLCHGV